MDIPQNGKDLFDYITIGVAGYAAILATFNFLRDLAKERKSLKIILESIRWRERHQILITNSGHRPITVNTINLMIIPKNKRGGYMNIPSGVFWANEEGCEPPKLPSSLKDGDSANFILSEYISGELHKKNHLSICVYDGEGCTYTKYREGEYDERYEYHEIKKKNQIRMTLNTIIYRIKKFFSPKR